MKYDAFSRLHPLTNFLFFVGAIGFSVVIQHPAYLLVSWIAAAVWYLMLTDGNGWKTILGLIPVFIIVAGLNPLFNTYGETVLFHVFGNPYTLEALAYGGVIAGMVVVMLLWFLCYSIVLTSDKFVCLFGRLIPSLSLLLVMVLRMVPEFTRKAKQFSGARDAIGKGIGAQSTKNEKLIGSMNLLSSLTDWALEGSIVTADSMRARGYGTAKRTSFRIYRMTASDRLLIAVMAVLAAAVLIWSDTTATFTPDFYIAPLNWTVAAYAAFLLIPVILSGKEEIQWRISLSKI